MNCFEFKELNFKFGIFDKSIDCSYIIHLEKDTNRLKNIKTQLNKYKPTKKIYIFNNKGFQNCKKNLYKQMSNYDIIDSYLQIFKHAKKNNYHNILILEDDFILDRLILQEDISKVNNFCNKNKHKNFMLSLGILSLIHTPINKDFNYSIIGIGTHNMIYSKKMIENSLNRPLTINRLGDWDLYTNLTLNKYFYKKPLIYQKFEESENQTNWFDAIGAKYIVLKYIQYLNFLKEPKKAFILNYKYSFILSFILFLSIIFLIIYLIRKKYHN